MQQGMLFYSLYDKKPEAYFEQLVFSIKGQLDIDILEKSLNKIIARYDILRAIYNHGSNKKPLQVILKSRTANIYFEDITMLEEDEKKLFVEAFKVKDKGKGFELSKDCCSGYPSCGHPGKITG